ncbi:MAG: hypothetical protein Q8M07_08510, partial [Prosthecobacter sp.]|nr:hypothetical protein [Prosthecobacter sp.]
MNHAFHLFLALTLWISATTSLAAELSPSLDLPATMIFSKGPNEYAGDALEITKGRGANIGWYVQAGKPEEVEVFIEYACEKPLDQAYQLSFDGKDSFWEVPVTQKGEWARAKLGTFQMRAGLPVLV